MKFRLEEVLKWNGGRGIRSIGHTECKAGEPQATGMKDGQRTPSIYLGAPGVEYEDCLKSSPRKVESRKRVKQPEFDREGYLKAKLNCSDDTEKAWNNFNRHSKRNVGV